MGNEIIKDVIGEVTQLTNEERDRINVICRGIKYKVSIENKTNHIEFPNTTWDSLNTELGNPYKNGESFRCSVKDFQRSLRGDGGEEHEYALPRVSTDDEKLLEIQKERTKLSTLRIDLNKTVRETARTELLLEEYLRAIDRLSESRKEFNFLRLEKQKEDTAYVLAFADAHYGKWFESFLNNYNIEEAQKRFNDLYSEICNLVLEKHINTLYVLNLGDMIEGLMLRVSQIQSVQIGLVDQTIEFMEFLTQWLEKLSEIVNIKYHQVKSSNHSQTRPFGAKPNEFVKEDMERIIYAHLKGMVKKNPRIELTETGEVEVDVGKNKNRKIEKFTTFKIFDYEYIILHGHEIKDWDNLLKDLSWKYRRFFDYGFVGHRHTGGSIQSGERENHNCELFRVPSMMGGDPYSDDLLKGCKAGAILVEFTKKQGKRSITDIILN